MLMNVIVAVAKPGQGTCQQGESLVLSGSEGYISSDVTRKTRAGSTMCPWRLEAEPGQHFSVTLVNFHHDSNANSRDRYG